MVIRAWLYRHFSFLEKRTLWWESKDPYKEDVPYSTYESPYPVTLGIVKEFWHRHFMYITACRELKVAYKVIDITSDNWLEEFRDSKCDAFLVNPSVQMSQWKNMFDERLRIVADVLKLKLFPGPQELYLYENKRRMAYWLESNGIPHAKTHVFYRREEAVAFAEKCEFPIVTKTSMGARASGVKIQHSRSELLKYINRAFDSGIIHADGDLHDPDWGCVILQEYIEADVEWRIINIGDTYVGNQKLKRGEYHSGSHLVGWVRPPDKLLDFVKSVKEIGGFKTVDLDIFEAKDGKYYVNEIQAIFGSFAPYQGLDNGVPGYFYFEDGQWKYQTGIYYQNASYNMRIYAVMKELGCDVPKISLDEDKYLDPADKAASIERTKMTNVDQANQ